MPYLRCTRALYGCRSEVLPRRLPRCTSTREQQSTHITPPLSPPYFSSDYPGSRCCIDTRHATWTRILSHVACFGLLPVLSVRHLQTERKTHHHNRWLSMLDDDSGETTDSDNDNDGTPHTPILLLQLTPPPHSSKSAARQHRSKQPSSSSTSHHPHHLSHLPFPPLLHTDILPIYGTVVEGVGRLVGSSFFWLLRPFAMFIHLLTIPKIKFLTHNSLAIAYFIFLAIGLCGLPWSGNRYLYSFGHAMPPGQSQAAAARYHCTHHHHSHHSLPPLPSLARALSQLGALGVGLELDAVCGGASAATPLDRLCLVLARHL